MAQHQSIGAQAPSVQAVATVGSQGGSQSQMAHWPDFFGRETKRMGLSEMFGNPENPQNTDVT